MWKTDYRPVEEKRFDVTDGAHRVRITKVEEVTTKNNKRAIALTLRVEGSMVPYIDYVVEGDYFDQKATRVFDAFKIQRNNWNYNQWINHEGLAEFWHKNETFLGNDGHEHTANLCKVKFYHNGNSENNTNFNPTNPQPTQANTEQVAENQMGFPEDIPW